jgi:hypothetical protein
VSLPPPPRCQRLHAEDSLDARPTVACVLRSQLGGAPESFDRVCERLYVSFREDAASERGLDDPWNLISPESDPTTGTPHQSLDEDAARLFGPAGRGPGRQYEDVHLRVSVSHLLVGDTSANLDGPAREGLPLMASRRVPSPTRSRRNGDVRRLAASKRSFRSFSGTRRPAKPTVKGRSGHRFGSSHRGNRVGDKRRLAPRSMLFGEASGGGRARGDERDDDREVPPPFDERDVHGEVDWHDTRMTEDQEATSTAHRWILLPCS